MPDGSGFPGLLVQLRCLVQAVFGARGRCDGELGQAPQVLHGGGQQELVPGTAQATEAELRQRQIALDAAEQDSVIIYSDKTHNLPGGQRGAATWFF